MTQAWLLKPFCYTVLCLVTSKKEGVFQRRLDRPSSKNRIAVKLTLKLIKTHFKILPIYHSIIFSKSLEKYQIHLNKIADIQLHPCIKSRQFQQVNSPIQQPALARSAQSGDMPLQMVFPRDLTRSTKAITSL